MRKLRPETHTSTGTPTTGHHQPRPSFHDLLTQKLSMALSMSALTTDGPDVSAPAPPGQVTAWIPAYHASASAVVDPTGGGNAFLGGLAIGLARGAHLEDAARWGSVAASFAIEQVGVPTVEGEGDEERWNGARVPDRMQEFNERLRKERAGR